MAVLYTSMYWYFHEKKKKITIKSLSFIDVLLFLYHDFMKKDMFSIIINPYWWFCFNEDLKKNNFWKKNFFYINEFSYNTLWTSSLKLHFINQSEELIC